VSCELPLSNFTKQEGSGINSTPSGKVATTQPKKVLGPHYYPETLESGIAFSPNLEKLELGLRFTIFFLSLGGVLVVAVIASPTRDPLCPTPPPPTSSDSTYNYFVRAINGPYSSFTSVIHIIHIETRVQGQTSRLFLLLLHASLFTVCNIKLVSQSWS
jgi:hypothetical protein